MGEEQARPARVLWLDLCAVLSFQLVVIYLVRRSGFTAISDDDYARVVIAQNFVAAPSLDPSGTSWLPFPFLFTGALLSLFGTALEVARAAAVLQSLGASALLYFAGKNLGIARTYLLPSVLTAQALPYAAFLSAATVPEYSAAAALVFAACSLPGSDSPLTRAAFPKRSWVAAGVLFLACASRYECWPVAVAFSALHLWRAYWSRKIELRANLIQHGLVSALAVLFPLLWVLHGLLHHGEAFFFVSRVVKYKQALGPSALPHVEALSSIPRALFFCEPEVVWAVLTTFLFLVIRGERRTFARLGWAWLVLFFMLSTLLVGAARGGAPTHHNERALLSLWLLCPLSVGLCFGELNHRKWRPSLQTATLLGALLGVGFRFYGPFERQPFVDRSEEEQIGRFAHQLLTSKRDRETTSSREPAAKQPVEIGVYTQDYGYFAIQAASSMPSRLVPLESHDPRAKNAGDVVNPGASALIAWRKTGQPYVAPATLVPVSDSVLFSTGTLVVASPELNPLD